MTWSDLLGCPFHAGGILRVLKIPKHMDRHTRAATRELMYLSSIRKFVVDINGRTILKKFAKTGTGISKSPARGFNLKFGQCRKDSVSLFGVHFCFWG